MPITLAAGGVTAGEIAGRRQLLFLGYPVELTQVLPGASAADAIGALFGNLRSGAVFGDRREFTFRRSEDFKFDEDVLAMLSTRRYDIEVHGAGEGSTTEVLSAVKTKAAA
ncbi:MAG: phage major capsid protein [Planctomycetota bacterium]